MTVDKVIISVGTIVGVPHYSLTYYEVGGAPDILFRRQVTYTRWDRILQFLWYHPEIPAHGVRVRKLKLYKPKPRKPRADQT